MEREPLKPLDPALRLVGQSPLREPSLIRQQQVDRAREVHRPRAKLGHGFGNEAHVGRMLAPYARLKGHVAHAMRHDALQLWHGVSVHR